MIMEIIIHCVPAKYQLFIWKTETIPAMIAMRTASAIRTLESFFITLTSLPAPLSSIIAQ